MLQQCYSDTETFSAVPIKHGTYRYAAACEVMLWPFAFGDKAVQVWDITSGVRMPSELQEGLDNPECIFIFHNAMFDRNALRLGNLKIEIPIHRVRCTMAQALAHSLPGGLEKLGEVFKLKQDQKKVADGKRLIHLFCKPQPKSSKIVRATRHTHPEEWAQFMHYAGQDVESMRAIHKKMPTWNYSGHELDLWHLDQKVNDRGIRVDVEFAQAAITAVDREQKRLASDVQERTGYNETAGEGVRSATQRDKLLAHILAEYGVALPDMQGATLERRVNDPDLPIELRELLAIRLEASTTSTSKYKALVNGVSADGRLRGTIQFDGAGRTGRDAGRVFQPQNLPRPKHKFAEIAEFIEATKADCPDLLFPGDVMALASSSIRSAIIAEPGKKLVVCDLSNIEGRFAAWLAGEEWKLQAFRDFDNGKGQDLYKIAYAKAFKIDPADIGDDDLRRQIGKVKELMLQYEGGVGAFITGADTYRIDLEEMTRLAWPEIPDDIKDEAAGFLQWTEKKNRSTFGLAPEVFMCCDALKRLWRYRQPMIASYWGELKEAWVEALYCGRAECRAVTFIKDAAWLRCVLPSGRSLCYPSPRVGDDGTLSYMGINQYTRQWQRIKTYGGKLLENFTQAGSRDVFKHCEVGAEAEGYETVLPVHDELVTETPDDPAWNIAGLKRIMSTVPVWAPGLPLAAAGMETTRYRKK